MDVLLIEDDDLLKNIILLDYFKLIKQFLLGSSILPNDERLCMKVKGAENSNDRKKCGVNVYYK